MFLTAPNSSQLRKSLSSTKTLVIIDSHVDDLTQLVRSLPQEDVIVLDPSRDGIEQITQALSSRKLVSSLHLVSHGTSGCLFLGNSKLSLETLSHYEHQIESWANALCSADVLVYGCQVAEGALGALFLQRLHQLTEANIAASTQRVGKIDGQLNWVLDAQLGEVQTHVIFSEALQQSYEGSFVEVSLDIEQDVAIETEETLVTFNFTLDEAPPAGGIVVVLSANETSSFNRFNPNFDGSNLQLNGIDPFLPNNDVSPDLDFSAFALNITQQNASFSIPVLNTSDADVSVDNPDTNPDIEDSADVAEEITWTISTIAPEDVPDGLGLGTPGTVAAGASSDSIIMADNPEQLSSGVPEVSITTDVTELVEDEDPTPQVTFTISLSEPPPSEGLEISLETGKPFALGDFLVLPPDATFTGIGGFTGFDDNSGATILVTEQTATITLPIFNDEDRVPDGSVTNPDDDLRNDDQGEEQTTFTVGPGDGYTVSADAGSVTLTLKDTNVVNTAPVAADDTATTDAGAAVNIDVLGNDSDAEGNDLTLAGVGTPDNGGTAEI
uniref:DUF4347 domain-containing protein n=1 Tax=Acaryochloris sp. IP29b_bin.137 TaxID=2969217 RepID=UPI0026157E4B